MIQENAARFFKTIQQSQDQAARRSALSQPDRFIQLAANLGYQFNVKTLEAEIEHLSEEEIAAIFNPGMGPRRHLLPK